MVDFHTHILPGIDDGAADVETSLKMLALEENVGVDTVVLTPHFYAHEQSPGEFFKKREAAFELLKSNYSGKITLRKGAELLYFEGISRNAELDGFCIDGTKTLLVEMPFHPWSRTYINEIIALHSRGYTVVLAHIERYLSRVNKKYIQELSNYGILFQSNAEFFIEKSTRRKAKKLLKNRKIALLGSDCHNLSDRTPNLSELKKVLDSDEFYRARTFAKTIIGA